MSARICPAGFWPRCSNRLDQDHAPLEVRLGLVDMAFEEADLPVDRRYLSTPRQDQVILAAEGLQEHAVGLGHLLGLAFLLGLRRREALFLGQLLTALGTLVRPDLNAMIVVNRVSLLGILGRHGIAALAHALAIGPTLDGGGPGLYRGCRGDPEKHRARAARRCSMCIVALLLG
jgi:hypothetical protein